MEEPAAEIRTGPAALTVAVNVSGTVIDSPAAKGPIRAPVSANFIPVVVLSHFNVVGGDVVPPLLHKVTRIFTGAPAVAHGVSIKSNRVMASAGSVPIPT